MAEKTNIFWFVLVGVFILIYLSNNSTTHATSIEPPIQFQTEERITGGGGGVQQQESSADSISELSIVAFYDENKDSLASHSFLILNNYEGVRYVKLKAIGTNRDTVPLTFRIVNSSPQGFSESIMGIQSLIGNPGEKVEFVTDLIDLQPYADKIQVFNIIIEANANGRKSIQKGFSITFDIKSNSEAQFDIDVISETPQESIGVVNLGNSENQFYQTYLSTYVRSNGAVIANHIPVSWCSNNNGCIACGKEISSEAIGRLGKVAFMAGDKDIFDREVDFYYTTMKHPSRGYMMWKLNEDGTSGSCGGHHSAVDAELIMIDALFDASSKWVTDSKGRRYEDTAKLMMDGLKSGVIEGKYLPYCILSDNGMACERKVFLGYLNLPALKRMCDKDSFWCPVYTESKSLIKQAIQNGGIYSAYNVDSKAFTFENADIHPNWAIKHLAMDSDDGFNSVNSFYDQSRAVFFNEGRKICQEFAPGSGCKKGNPPLRVYATYLEIASARGDTQFRDALISFINQKRLEDSSLSPLAAQDNYGNIVILEAYGEARKSGGIVG